MSGEKRRFWTATEDAVLRERYGQDSVYEIAVALGRTRDSVKHRARKLGITEEAADEWSLEETAYLRANYETLTTPEIAAHLGRTVVAVRVRAAVLGLKSRHRSGVNSLVPGYFKVIDTPMKAYLLGLLVTDGSISRANQLKLELHEKDRCLAELAREHIAPGARIGSYVVKQRSGTLSPMVRFMVSSADLAADLARHGVVNRKTLITRWPAELPREHEGSFLCGVSDGDGSLERKWIYHWSLTSGSYEFLIQVQERIMANIGVRAGSHPYRDSRKENTWKIAVTGMPVRALDAWMHRDVPGLARKRLPPEGQLKLDITG